MSEIHLSAGSTKPPKVEGKLRLYGMLFCPFVLRVRLVLHAKRIPHDVVYVDLQNKPEWLFELNPKGQVPVLDDGTKIITESLDICYYLEEKYPEPSLCPRDANQLKKDKEFLQHVADAVNQFYLTLSLVGKKQLKDVLSELEPVLAYFDGELAARGNFFGGETAGLVDYMAWPWAEKLPILNLIFNEEVDIPEKYDNLKKWRKSMLEEEPVKETILPMQRHYEYTVFVRQRNKINVNNV